MSAMSFFCCCCLWRTKARRHVLIVFRKRKVHPLEHTYRTSACIVIVTNSVASSFVCQPLESVYVSLFWALTLHSSTGQEILSFNSEKFKINLIIPQKKMEKRSLSSNMLNFLNVNTFSLKINSNCSTKPMMFNNDLFTSWSSFDGRFVHSFTLVVNLPFAFSKKLCRFFIHIFALTLSISVTLSLYAALLHQNAPDEGINDSFGVYEHCKLPINELKLQVNENRSFSDKKKNDYCVIFNVQRKKMRSYLHTSLHKILFAKLFRCGKEREREIQRNKKWIQNKKKEKNIKNTKRECIGWEFCRQSN